MNRILSLFLVLIQVATKAQQPVGTFARLTPLDGVKLTSVLEVKTVNKQAGRSVSEASELVLDTIGTKNVVTRTLSFNVAPARRTAQIVVWLTRFQLTANNPDGPLHCDTDNSFVTDPMAKQFNDHYGQYISKPMKLELDEQLVIRSVNEKKPSIRKIGLFGFPPLHRTSELSMILLSSPGQGSASWTDSIRTENGLYINQYTQLSQNSGVATIELKGLLIPPSVIPRVGEAKPVRKADTMPASGGMQVNVDRQIQALTYEGNLLVDATSGLLKSITIRQQTSAKSTVLGQVVEGVTVKLFTVTNQTSTN
jgi:hypothetical protein